MGRRYLHGVETRGHICVLKGAHGRANLVCPYIQSWLLIPLCSHACASQTLIMLQQPIVGLVAAGPRRSQAQDVIAWARQARQGLDKARFRRTLFSRPWTSLETKLRPRTRTT